MHPQGPDPRAISTSQGPPQNAHDNHQNPPPPKTKTPKAPRRKVIAGTLGGSIGTNIAVVIAYQFPDLPPTVVSAYSGFLILFLTFVAGYLIPDEGT